MHRCGHCKEDYNKHGYPFTCLGPNLLEYYGKNQPPDQQEDDWPDPRMICRTCGNKYSPTYDRDHALVLWPEEDCCPMCI